MRTHLLLVEGKDDRRVVQAAAKVHGVECPDIEFPADGGFAALLPRIGVHIKARLGSLRRFGVMLDADADPVARWKAIAERLAEWTQLPPLPPSRGFVGETDLGFSVAVWLMPDNEAPGALEDFLYPLIPEAEARLPHVDRFLQALPPELKPPNPAWYKKARIHALLSVQERPGVPLGTAITAGYLDATRADADEFVDWLRKAFQP